MTAGGSLKEMKTVKSLTLIIELEMDITDLETLGEIFEKMSEYGGYKVTDARVNRA